ncbi:hypothetical protein H9K75_17690 [Diaphorobacter aerolatus]|uniref:receptor protein-tyrosine kinase n=1 Tax=Diaphorobacter aerolatus TaxID=1288495 RepID=A0A7H0GI15_9BURK|nr:hypothetical protein H9K75_17690 [Diaphorobacter aerolatus]
MKKASAMKRLCPSNALSASVAGRILVSQMSRWSAIRIMFAVTALLGFSAVSQAQSCAVGETPAAFGFTGGEQTTTVPAGVHSLTVYLSGAQGGAGRSGAGTIGNSPNSPGGAGGLGGRVRGTLSVTPGSTLSIWVGGQGSQAVNPGGLGEGTNGIGGGATDLRVGGNGIGNRVAIAGGGGGGGNAGWSDSVVAGGVGGVGVVVSEARVLRCRVALAPTAVAVARWERAAPQGWLRKFSRHCRKCYRWQRRRLTQFLGLLCRCRIWRRWWRWCDDRGRRGRRWRGHDRVRSKLEWRRRWRRGRPLCGDGARGRRFQQWGAIWRWRGLDLFCADRFFGGRPGFWSHRPGYLAIERDEPRDQSASGGRASGKLLCVFSTNFQQRRLGC